MAQAVTHILLYIEQQIKFFAQKYRLYFYKLYFYSLYLYHLLQIGA